MVIDKTGIMAIMRSSEEELKQNKDKDSIYISTRYDDFSPTEQIGNDSIDLRINDKGYIISNDFEYINTLSEEDFSKYFVEVTLTTDKGYDLKPGDILFIDTLERINLVGDLIGRITGRSVFSRFGLSVHCTQDKFSSGINSIVALQIVNNSNTVLKIFPYQKLAQLIIHKTSHNQNPYENGTFSLEETLKLPIIKPKDRAQYDSRTQSNILRLKPKKNSIIKKRRKSAKLNSFAQSVLGCIVSIGIGIMGFLNVSFVSIISIAILSIIFVLGSLYFYTASEDID